MISFNDFQAYFAKKHTFLISLGIWSPRAQKCQFQGILYAILHAFCGHTGYPVGYHDVDFLKKYHQKNNFSLYITMIPPEFHHLDTMWL